MPIHSVNRQWTNHDSWVLAHKGFVAKPSAILLLGNVIVCAGEDCPRKAGMVLESTSPLLVNAYIYNCIRQVNVFRVWYTSCVTSYDLPRLMNMSMACLPFFSCFSGPVFSRSENELKESQQVKEWNPMLVTTHHLRQRSIVWYPSTSSSF